MSDRWERKVAPAAMTLDRCDAVPNPLARLDRLRGIIFDNMRPVGGL
jgi:hypothetical protein